ncbi:DinB family protein [Christiangramia portivictoriae]|uniref:DinB family protein n=1 Tax=Christiangramia portivictoriae TaxID=326069 RepID=UPI00041FE1E0|nr:DinB family protein [Christiangramia portivictoriae]
MKKSKLEYWLRGKVDKVPDLLQPAAHALLQTREELRKYLGDFPAEQLWTRPAGRASVGFHLQHIAGVTNRLITYAQGKQLSDAQLQYLKLEGKADSSLSLEELINHAENELSAAVEFLKLQNPEDLTNTVEVGRKKIESSLIGVLFHAAEHSQRHVGQMLVTMSVVKNC